jgi:hypothetical protein
MALSLAVAVIVVLGLRSASAASLYDIPAATPPRVLDGRYFGTHFHRLLRVPNDNEARETAWPAGQIGALRLWDSGTRWADLEPARGSFRFDRLDGYLVRAEAQGVPVLMVLGSAPRWAAVRPAEPGPYGPGSAAEPANLDDWDRYVTALARRYKGRIAEYELWNEPYFSDLPADRGQPSAFFTGSVASMVALAQRTRAVLDREDPQAVLLTPGFVGGPQRLAMFLQDGGGRYVGGVAYHFYADDEPGFLQLQHDVRAVMARHGLARLPLLNTESGFGVGPEAQALADGHAPDRTAAASLLARSLVLGAYQGLDRYYQYAWDNGRSGMLLPGSHQATASAEAFAAVRRWLLGTRLLGCHQHATGVVQCDGARGDERLLIAWQPVPGRQAVLPWPAPAQVLSTEHAVARPRPAHLPIHLPTGQAFDIGPDPLAIWWRPLGAGPGTP